MMTNSITKDMKKVPKSENMSINTNIITSGKIVLIVPQAVIGMPVVRKKRNTSIKKIENRKNTKRKTKRKTNKETETGKGIGKEDSLSRKRGMVCL